MGIDSYTFDEAEKIRFGGFPVLDTILYRWSRRIEETLFEKFHAELYAGSSVVEEMKFSTFFASLKKPRPIYTFEINQLAGQGLFVLDNRFAKLCLEESHDAVQETDHLSPQNQRKLQEVVQALIREFELACEDIFPVSITLKKITTYLFRARILNPHEPCLVAQIHIAGQENSSRLIWCFPKVMLDPIIRKKQADPTVPTLYPERILPRDGDTERFMEKTQFRLGITMGTVNISAGKGIRVGDVLPIANDLGGEVMVRINDQPLIAGRIGKTGERYAVKISGTYQERKKSVREKGTGFEDISWPVVRE